MVDAQALDRFLTAKEKLDAAAEPAMDDVMETLHKLTTVRQCSFDIECAF